MLSVKEKINLIGFEENLVVLKRNFFKFNLPYAATRPELREELKRLSGDVY